MTADEDRKRAEQCRAEREPRNNYDEAAFCQLAPGHLDDHHQSTPWPESWKRVESPDAGGTAMTDERLAEIREEIRGMMFISPRTVQELMREVERSRLRKVTP